MNTEFAEEETGCRRADYGDRIDLLTDQGLHRPRTSVAFCSELSAPFGQLTRIYGVDSSSTVDVRHRSSHGLVLLGCPKSPGLRLNADELKAEIAQPVEESVKL